MCFQILYAMLAFNLEINQLNANTQEEAGKRLDNLMKRADRNKDGVITKADFRHGKKGGKGKKHRS